MIELTLVKGLMLRKQANQSFNQMSVMNVMVCY